MPAPAAIAPEAPAAVLDTNVALDWLVFAEPSFAPLQHALAAGKLRWLACPRMHDELAHVLEHRVAARRTAPSAELLARWRAGVRWCAAPAPTSQRLPRCRDADDQVFIDLAVEQRARWLITRLDADERRLLEQMHHARAGYYVSLKALFALVERGDDAAAEQAMQTVNKWNNQTSQNNSNNNQFKIDA